MMESTARQAYGHCSWYAVTTRSRQEKVIASMLESLEVSHFLPLFEEERQWSDRKQRIRIPLFPGYVFVSIDRSNENLLRVRKVPGVVDFVGNRSGPLSIPEKEIEDIRAVLFGSTACSPHPFLKTGDRVRVIRGPLTGVEGCLVRSGSQSKLVISVEMIQRAVAVSVTEYDVEAAASLPAQQVPYDPQSSPAREAVAR